ncbi:MAG: HlyD family efflux transporter periplasmic adaptor subunit [Phycisphaerales bacterium]
MIVRTIVIPALAVAGVSVAVYTAAQSNKPVKPADPVASPATSPFATPVAGAGIVEASTQNIAIGTNVAGIATKVFAKVGDVVKAGDPLFQIDDRSLRAQLAVRQAELGSRKATLAAAKAKVKRDQDWPRPEQVPPLQAQVTAAEAALADANVQLNNAQNAAQVPGVIAAEELDKRRWAVEAAKARLAQARSELTLTTSGTWQQDLAVTAAQATEAESQVQAAEANVAATQTELDRLTVKAPTDGQVLQVNIRTGEFAQAGPLTVPLMLFGATGTLHVRVDIDENDAWRVKADAKARASLRGNATLSTDLTFVRIEPYVVPKKSLTGDSSERVDTRVLQVLYSFPGNALPVYVGQQMDVFIDAGPTAPKVKPNI